MFLKGGFTGWGKGVGKGGGGMGTLGEFFGEARSPCSKSKWLVKISKGCYKLLPLLKLTVVIFCCSKVDIKISKDSWH